MINQTIQEAIMGNTKNLTEASLQGSSDSRSTKGKKFKGEP